MLVFDSATTPARERNGAIIDTITSAASATLMTPDRAGEPMHMRMHLWNLGGVEVFDTSCSAHTLRRTARQAAADGEDAVMVTGALKGKGTHLQRDEAMKVYPHALWGTHLSEAYLHHVSDTRTVTAKIPLQVLALSEDLVLPALARLGSSPLAPLFFHHLVEVPRVADDLDDLAAAALGTSTLALARALFASVSGDARLSREHLDDVLLQRIAAFVRQHLGDPALKPATIAAAHHVSVRHLYKTCARAGVQLEQWIIQQRLERAREDLARVALTHESVAEVAHRWGFVSAAHFARRFRSAYDMSPREWQALNREIDSAEQATGS